MSIDSLNFTFTRPTAGDIANECRAKVLDWARLWGQGCEGAQQVAEMLAAIDWAAEIEAKRVEEALRDEIWANHPVACASCGERHPTRVMTSLADLPSQCYGVYYCSTCAERIRQTYTRTCGMCGTPYIAKTMNQRQGLCQECYSKDKTRELHRVNAHNERAAAVGLPATLTLPQWLATLDYFNGQCAYCQIRPFTELDHYVPLSAGGGTTASNCVPACRTCNSSKGPRAPDVGQMALLPGAALERVGAYLAQVLHVPWQG